MRRPTLAAAVAFSALVLPMGVAVASPDDRAPSRGDQGQVPSALPAAGPPGADRNNDHVSDDFEHRLAAADASERLRVIVMGLDSTQGRRAVGAFRLEHELEIINGFAGTMTAAQARALARDPRLRRIEEDGVVRALDDATDRDFGAAAARADVPGLDGSGVGICVIDTGIEPSHEQIAPRTVGFVDYVNGRTTAYDDHGHGTHVASIAAGDGIGGSDAATFAGVAPGADLYAAKVLDSSGSGADSDVAAAVQWCHEQAGVDVLSLSLGSDGTDGKDAVSSAVNAAVAGGEVVVVAAGNSGDAPGTISAPGVAVDAVTVGAVADHSAPAGTARRDDGIWLAAFSSRGPTLSGLTKPDVTAPGVTVTAADAGTVSGYVTYSGTSMATPYVSGAVALALEAAPGAAPAEVKSALKSSALDVGVAGNDNDWGAGLVDVRALVDAIAGVSPGHRTAFPTRLHDGSGSVPDNGAVDVPIAVGSDGLGVPLAVTVTATTGRLNCDIYCQLGLSAGEWSPDLDVELRDPAGNVVAESQCALSGVSCASGRQETIGIRPQVAGTYVLHVYAWPGGDGAGGTFDVDVFRGPLTGGTVEEPPPPAANQPPVADAGPDQRPRVNRKTKQATFTLSGSASDADGAVVSLEWREGATRLASGSTATLDTSVTRPVGTYTFTLVATDDDGATGTDTVTVTVRR